MAEPSTTSTPFVPAQIRVTRVHAEPASMLIEMSGVDAQGQPTIAIGHFDTAQLTHELFGPLMAGTITDLTHALIRDATGTFLQPATIAELQSIYDLDVFPEGFPQLVKAARLLRLVSRQASVGAAFSIQRAAGLDVSTPFPDQLETAPASEENTQRDAPGPADASSPTDGASSSSSIGGGEDLPSVPERLPELVHG